MPKNTRQRGVAFGRHRLGTLGDIISECPGDFVGIGGDLERCLIFAPGNLVEQWQEELMDKFGLAFERPDRGIHHRQPIWEEGDTAAAPPRCLASLVRQQKGTNL